MNKLETARMRSTKFFHNGISVCTAIPNLYKKNSTINTNNIHLQNSIFVRCKSYNKIKYKSNKYLKIKETIYRGKTHKLTMINTNNLVENF